MVDLGQPNLPWYPAVMFGGATPSTFQQPTSDAAWSQEGATHNAEPNEALLRWNLWVYEPLLLGRCCVPACPQKIGPKKMYPISESMYPPPKGAPRNGWWQGKNHICLLRSKIDPWCHFWPLVPGVDSIHCAKEIVCHVEAHPTKCSAARIHPYFWIASCNRSRLNVVNPRITIQNTASWNWVYHGIPLMELFMNWPPVSPPLSPVIIGWQRCCWRRPKHRESSFFGPNQSKSQSWHQYLQPREYGTLFGSWWWDRNG